MSELMNINRKATPQRERATKAQVRNNAGGYVFKVDLWDQVRRFLILGTEGGTYYVSAPALTKANAKVIEKAAATDARRLVDLIVEVSDKALAPKNSPALFALAVALTDAPDADKAYVREAVNKVARTGTHLFEFAQYVENLGGWGRSKRKALAGWYEAKSADALAFQAVKYRQRSGWTHRDVMRLAHPQGVDQAVGAFILGKNVEGEVNVPLILAGFAEMQQAQDVKTVVSILGSYPNLPWETIPTQFLKDAEVWKTLFYNGMGTTALIRNITRFAELGMFKDMVFARDVATRLTDAEQLRKGRIHPVQFLVAGHVYENGKPARQSGGYSYYGSYQAYNKNWDNSPVIKKALDDGFYAAFGTLEPANKRTLLALDVSGSMSAQVAGLQGISAAKGAAAMAMVTARTEPYFDIRGFTSGSGGYGWGRSSAVLTDMGISAGDSLDTVMRKTAKHNFGATDCAQPMLWAKENKVEIDTFVVYTDNETWAGNVQPFQALKDYRQTMGRDARLVVVGMTSTEFTIADPSDAGMLDVVGFDASAPGVIANFSAGR